MRYFHFCAHEQFPPDALLEQAVAAERAGFDGIGCSDHLQPWWEGGESGHAWVWLGAVGQATERVPLGTGVTPPGPRFHPVLIAQPDEFYTDDWHRPKDMYEEGERQISDEDLAQAFIISSDPGHHVERIREVERMGATTVVLMNNSGADPLGAVATYGERVLPALRNGD